MNMKSWLTAAGIRAIKTVAQTALALIGTNATGITDVNWFAVLSASLLSAVMSILTSLIVGLPEVQVQQIKLDQETSEHQKAEDEKATD